MEDHMVISAVIIVFLMFASIVILAVYASTKSRREYNRIKNMAESEGIITEIEFHSAHLHTEGDHDYYNVSYSFTDIQGKPHEKKFSINKRKRNKDDLKEGDKITVYYDIDDPNKCVTDYKLKADKNQWWQALIVIAVIVVVPFIIAFDNCHK